MTESLPHEVALAATYQGKLALIEEHDGLHLPHARLECAESIEKTLRRALYEQSGAVLGSCCQLGTAKSADAECIEVAVGSIQWREPTTAPVAWCTPHEALRLLQKTTPQAVLELLREEFSDEYEPGESDEHSTAGGTQQTRGEHEK